jgi:nucleoside-diphosphate-sugar epimerase
MSKRTVLVLGISGGIGGEVAHAFATRGWHVRALTRGAMLDVGSDIEVVHGDAMNRAAVIAAASGADAIFHGVNPPRYENWRGLALPMLDNTIAAARASGARILFPGTIYNFGPDAGDVLDEDSPQHPLTRKGRIRVEMERALESASREGVATTIVRAGDFFGPHTGSSWFSQALVQSGKPVRRVMYPGPLDIGHSWAYLPDLAQTFAQLAEVATARFERFHFRGYWLPRGGDLIDVIRRVAACERLTVRRMPWWAIPLVAPFSEQFREMLEMKYLWYTPHQLVNQRVIAALGSEPHTPIEEAVRATLSGMGCVEDPQHQRCASYNSRTESRSNTTNVKTPRTAPSGM